jgi:hypothetical protein
LFLGIIKKMDNGFGIQASSGGKVVLINCCLDNLATYAMSFFLLYEGAHAKMDMVRERYFWEGFGDKKKYHIVRWEIQCKPKDFGLDFLDSRTRNTRWYPASCCGTVSKCIAKSIMINKSHI